MAPPSALAIASGAVMRLSWEEASYRTELAAQEAKAKALEDQIKSGGDTDDTNAEFMLRQQADGREGQRLAIKQTKAVFEPLRRQIAEARARLEEQMEASEGGADVSAADVEQARAVLAQTKSP